MVLSLLADLAWYTFAAVAAVVVSVVVKALLTTVEHMKAYKAYEGYWGPKPDFPFGNVLVRKKWHGRSLDVHIENLEQHTDAAHPCYKILMPLFCKNVYGLGTELVTADPRVVKHVLQDKFDVWAKSNNGGRVAKPFVRFFGNGIFVSDHGPHAENPADHGKMWHTQRRTAAAIFTRNLFKSYYEGVFLEHTRRMVELLQAAGTVEAPVDMQKWFNALTFECFGKIALGADLRTLEGKDTIGPLFDRSQMLAMRFLAKNVGTLVLCELFPRPLRDLLEHAIESRSALHQELVANVDTFDAEIDKIVQEKRRLLAEGCTDDKSSSDLLALFLRMGAEEGDGFSDAALRDITKHFILAGRDTTASLLSFLFYRLGLPQNAAALDTILAELDAVLQGSAPTHDDMQQLPHLRGAIWETLRLHPVVPVITVVAKADDTLPDGVTVPKGTRMLVCAYAMGRSRERYGEDALEFRPDRWIPFKMPDPAEFPVFKAGRRICLGRDMALFEATTVAAVLLQHFRPETVNPDAYTYGSKLTMCVHDRQQGKDQLMMRLHPRA